jgi:hypothetical protein
MELFQRKRSKWPKVHEEMLIKEMQMMAIKEMQIKTTLRFHLTPVKMIIIKITTERLQDCS